MDIHVYELHQFLSSTVRITRLKLRILWCENIFESYFFYSNNFDSVTMLRICLGGWQENREMMDIWWNVLMKAMVIPSWAWVKVCVGDMSMRRKSMDILLMIWISIGCYTNYLTGVHSWVTNYFRRIPYLTKIVIRSFTNIYPSMDTILISLQYWLHTWIDIIMLLTFTHYFSELLMALLFF